MRPALAAALAAATFVSSPAHATQGLLCRPATGTGPSLNVVIGSGVSSVIVGATLIEGRAARSTMGERAPLAVGQSWIDPQRLWIDLTDANALRYEARLRLLWSGRGRARHLAGTLERNGRVYRVRCIES